MILYRSFGPFKYAFYLALTYVGITFLNYLKSISNSRNSALFKSRKRGSHILEIKNEKGEVCFFDDLTMIKNTEYWFGAQFTGKKTFTIYNSNKTIFLFQITSI